MIGRVPSVAPDADFQYNVLMRLLVKENYVDTVPSWSRPLYLSGKVYSQLFFVIVIFMKFPVRLCACEIYMLIKSQNRF